MENNDVDNDDDEDVIVDVNLFFLFTNHRIFFQTLGDNLGELSVGTTTALPVHRIPMTNSLKQITKKAILPAIRITGACEADGDEVLLNTGDCLNE